MTSRDYTREIGLPSQQKKLSRPVAYAILVLVAVGISLGVAGVFRATSDHHAAEKQLATPAKS